jgi:hypothetical protein
VRWLSAGWLTLALLAAPPAAAAQEADPLPPVAARPTSGEASLQSGRTLGTGQVMVAGAVGWPWIWAQLEVALTSSFNLGIRASLLYGSPVMALEAGAGGELSVPMRIHLHGEGDLDVAVFATPAFTFGEASTAGEGGTVFAGDFGWSSRLEAGGVIGWRAMEGLTLLAGAGGHAGFVHTPEVGDPEVVGALFARLGVEGLISRDTMLFAAAEGGVGFAPSRLGVNLFREPFPPFLRLSLGVAYLM